MRTVYRFGSKPFLQQDGPYASADGAAAITAHAILAVSNAIPGPVATSAAVDRWSWPAILGNSQVYGQVVFGRCTAVTRVRARSGVELLLW
jgi:hypothetical protein